MQPAQVLAPPVPLGPRAYRRRIRRLGPIAGLLPPSALGAMALLLLHDNTSTVRGVLGFLFAVLAAVSAATAGSGQSGASRRVIRHQTTSSTTDSTALKGSSVQVPTS